MELHGRGGEEYLLLGRSAGRGFNVLRLFHLSSFKNHVISNILVRLGSSISFLFQFS